MKFLQCAIFLAALIAATTASNATWGKRNGTDVLLMKENVFRGAVNNAYTSLDVAFPKSGQTNTRTITGIFVYDRFTNSSGATPNLWSGGPGYKFATINFKSQYGKGVNSTVEIYGLF